MRGPRIQNVQPWRGADRIKIIDRGALPDGRGAETLPEYAGGLILNKAVMGSDVCEAV